MLIKRYTMHMSNYDDISNALGIRVSNPEARVVPNPQIRIISL